MNERSKAFVTGIIILFFSGCMARETVKDGSGYGAGKVLESVVVLGETIRIAALSDFRYDIVEQQDPYRLLVTLKGIDAGKYRDQVVVSQGGVKRISFHRATKTGGAATEAGVAIEIVPEAAGQHTHTYENHTLSISFSPQAAAVQGTSRGQVLQSKAAPVKEAAKAAGKEAGRITAVAFTSVEDAVELEIRADGPVMPDVFTLEGRLVIDVPHVKLATEIPGNGPSPVKDIRWAEHPDKVRIVLDLLQDVSHKVVLQGPVAVVTFYPAGKGMAAVGKTPRVQGEKQAGKQPEKQPEKQAEKAGEHPAGHSVQRHTGPLTALMKMEGDRTGKTLSGSFQAVALGSGKRITVDFTDADILPVIGVIADVSGLNIVTGSDVAGRVTVKLKDVTWEEALDAVLAVHDYRRRMEGGIIIIESQEKGKDKAKGPAIPAGGPSIYIKDLTVTLYDREGQKTYNQKTFRKSDLVTGTGKIHIDMDLSSVDTNAKAVTAEAGN